MKNLNLLWRLNGKMKTYFKSILRMFSKHFSRFLTLIAIVIVSIGFMSGIGEVENKINVALDNYYISQNVSDFLIKSSNPTGFSNDEILYFQDKFGNENVMFGFSYDTNLDKDVVRIYNLDLNNTNINKFELIEGNLPANSNEILVERKTSSIKGYNLNDKINIQGNEFIVSGIVVNPLILHKVDETSYIEGETLDNVIYLNNLVYPINDIYITLSNRNLFESFSKNYEKLIKETKTEINEDINNVTVLSLYENFGIYSLHSYAEKVGKIGIIFIIFFLLVTSLVVFSTMTRLLDEERSQIACMKTLGYSNFAIISRYLLFIFFATLIGGIIALGVGVGLTNIIYSAFNMQYVMPAASKVVKFYYYAFTLAIIMVSTIVVTFLTGLNILKSQPANLLTPKAPKAGKKVFIEYMPFIWNKLSFKYKSCLRNVLLFKSRFFMTVISIMGSTVLVLAGLSLLDNALLIETATSIIALSVVLIVFAGILSALVIYNLTNINISERKREIATLMVLGYKELEVSTYIFREIYIMSSIGAVLGLPLGYFFINFVFNFIQFGSVSQTNWWSWILAPIAAILFTFISTLLLKPKIVKTDMNASLKTVE